MPKILVIDDEDDICLLIRGILVDEGYSVLTASSSDQGYQIIAQDKPDLVIQDIWLQGSSDDGIQVLQNVKKQNPDLPFLMISGHGTIETAVSSIKLGAYDFIEKPFKSDRLLLMINRALENVDLKRQNAALRKETRQNLDIQIKSLPDSVCQTLNKCAKTNSRVFITGEVGTGKTIAAQYLHQLSARADQPFILHDCNNKDLDNSLSAARGGTLLLNEVHKLDLQNQSALLNILQQDDSDIRFLASTTSDIEKEMQNNNFREELYYRLNVVPVHLVSLRARKSKFRSILENCDFQFSDMAIAKFLSYSWPGNLKELHNVLEWIGIMHRPGSEICIDQLPPEFGNVPKEHNRFSSIEETFTSLGLREARERFERYYLQAQLDRFDGNISKTAEFIGMERSALHRKLKSLNVFSDDKQDVA